MASEELVRNLTNAAFRFVIDVGGERQAAFTECSLPLVEWDIEKIQEGGLNTFVHQLPGRRKPATVSLKNGVGKSDLLKWYMSTMSEQFERKTVTISLLDPMQNPVMVWHIENACPAKLTGPQLKSDANTIAIQTLELICGEITLS